MSLILIGIDLGGTKIEILVISDDGIEVLRNRVATPKNNYHEIIDAIATLIKNAENELKKKCSVGVCMPGSLSPITGLLRNSNTTCMNGKPFKQDLEEELGRELRMANDANCFALSEAMDGAAQDAHAVFGVIVGTGTGGGLVINKQVLVGVNAIAGEWGHNPLPWPEDGELVLSQCWCGQQGCIENFLSGPGFENDYRRELQDKNNLDAKQIATLAEQGDAIAEKALCRYEHRMARCFAHVINIFDPNTIVLGGGMSNVMRLYENVPKIWQEWIFSNCINTKLVPAKYGDSSGVRGAAWLWNH